MNKGQIFSTDLLFGMVIIIFGFGLMLALTETSSFDAKHARIEKQLQEKTEVALLLLTSSPIGQCDLNVKLPYSINTEKLTSLGSVALKKALLLEDNNVSISLSGGTTLINETPNTANIISIDLNVFVCDNSTKFSDLNTCLSSTIPCNNLQTLTIKVGQ